MLSITDTDFQKIQNIMYNQTGVFLKDAKKNLVIARLRRRLEELGLDDFSGYIRFLEDVSSNELEFFVNAITTNETYFFRHTEQFNYLFEKLLPALVEEKSRLSQREVKIWSAACSTGEEPYSLSILCHEFFKKNHGFRFSILASDINSKVLEQAVTAQYSERSLREVSAELDAKYFVHLPPDRARRGLDITVIDAVKKNVRFVAHNLLKPMAGEKFDIIFLRNVIIYFDKQTKQHVVNLIENNLNQGGHLFISLSESLMDIKTGLNYCKPGVYCKK
ncbi:protein-glutamate O-methyltransferase CheR [bacterium]|nr:protein-glutamate O-methyltransferase CheR [bacterium]MCP5462209.1 protein-glutamate O-methyltransferase CheR [bacterium]